MWLMTMRKTAVIGTDRIAPGTPHRLAQKANESKTCGRGDVGRWVVERDTLGLGIWLGLGLR